MKSSAQIERCPDCGAEATMWGYVESTWRQVGASLRVFMETIS